MSIGGEGFNGMRDEGRNARCRFGTLEVSVLAIDANGTTLTCSPPPVDLAGARTAAV